MRTLYFDCFAGASGNMILGALIDAGVDANALTSELKKLNIPGFELAIERVNRAGIAANHVSVRIPDEKHHRHLSDIERIIEGSTVSDGVKTRSKSIFRRLAEAEARVHGIETEKVHFHEVGGLDAIIDIVGSCIGFELLKIGSFICSKINVGSGFVEIQHGRFPVPPPAVAELLKGIPIFAGEIEGEMTTPTGAAIITTVATGYGTIPEVIQEAIGYGAGSRTHNGFPNVLRIFVGESAAENRTDTGNSLNENLLVLETNIDDSTPQTVGFVLERALDLGANDCWITSIQMKKNRPAFMITVLCRPDLKTRMLELLYSETSTLGIRVTAVERDTLERENVSANTRFGTIDVKISKRHGQIVNAMPEYDDVRAAAIKHNVPFTAVQDAALNALNMKVVASSR
jgi:pyridinium-3,5-bisthiocarboxylic acid mononucleotide nickel chelatase